MTLEQMILTKLDDLCNRLSKMEEKLDNHIKEKQRKEKTKKDLILISIAIISSITAIYQVIL